VDNGSTEAIPNQLAACELTLTWIPSSVFRIDITVEVVILSSRLGLMNVRAGNMKLHFPKAVRAYTGLGPFRSNFGTGRRSYCSFDAGSAGASPEGVSI
jgi:hypothetical protein